MNHLLAFPVLIPLLASLAALAMHRRVGPTFAAVSLAITAIALTTGVAAAAAFYSTVVVIPPERAGWCRALLGHHVHPNPIVGVTAAGLAIVVAARALMWWMHYRQALRALPAGDGLPLVVLDCPDVVAFAHPGGSGSVVVSSGLLRRLPPRQRLVVLAHERAHLDLHHPRLLVLAEIAAAGCPLGRPLARAVRWCTERAADEATATLVGDRRLVAETIAIAGLAQAPAGLAGISGSTVIDRVEALLSPEPNWSFTRSLTLALTATGAFAGAAFQAHHLAEVVLHLG